MLKIAGKSLRIRRNASLHSFYEYSPREGGPVVRRGLSLNSRDHAFNLLGLKTFNDDEIRSSYERLQHSIPSLTHSSTAPINPDSPAHAIESNTVSSQVDGDITIKNSDLTMKTDGSKVVIDVEEGIRFLAASDQANAVRLDEKGIQKVTELVMGKRSKRDTASRQMSFAQYKKAIVSLGEKLDPRVWNIGLSFLFTGTSVGIVIPCMPLLVSQLHIPASEFGLVVSAFGLSKLLGNIPSGYFVEKYGRKPSMVYGLGMCGVGLGALGLALLPGFGTPWLITCRLVSGLGVSGFVAGGFMFMSDISTPLNRTRTIAPVMAGFSAGAALGPAVGGVLIDSIGISATYATVGGMFMSLAALNAMLLHETKNFVTLPPSPASIDKTSTVFTNPSPQLPEESTYRGVINSFHTAFNAWKELLADPNPQIKNLVKLNGMFWFTVSGTQMTLLPLLMVAPRSGDVGASSLGLAMSAGEIGGCFAFMSLVSFLCSQPMAYFADKYGKVPAILTGCGLLSASMLALPLTTGEYASVQLSLPFFSALPDYAPILLAVLTPFALGNTALNATPTAMMSDLTDAPSRAQALSLLRTSGDLGLLLGASFAGALAHYASLDTALITNGALTAAAMVWFVSKQNSYSPFSTKQPVKTS